LQAAHPTLSIPLTDSACPVLKLMEHLQIERWRVSGELVHHRVDGLKVFDNRKLSGKRAYLRCLVQWELIAGAMPAGQELFMPSAECVAYYELMLYRPWFARFCLQVAARHPNAQFDGCYPLCVCHCTSMLFCMIVQVAAYCIALLCSWSHCSAALM
jgi:hypothetical protein